MAGEWIKLRGGLFSHPRLFALLDVMLADEDMAQCLLEKCVPAESITHDSFPPKDHDSPRHNLVTNVTMGALLDVTLCAVLRVWLAVNEHGKMVNGDAVMPHMTLNHLDTVGGILLIGEAMERVGWVRAVEGNDGNCLIFPNFSEHNSPSSSRPAPKTPAERKAKERARKRALEDLEKEAAEDVTKVTKVTQRREEKNIKEIGGVSPPDAPKKSSRFVPPTVGEVRAYCAERKNGIDPQAFIDHYEANGWMRGKNKVKDWKACVRTWEAKRAEQRSSDDTGISRRAI